MLASKHATPLFHYCLGEHKIECVAWAGFGYKLF
jgi:hypothetical protein